MLGACQLSGGNSLGTWSWAVGGFPPGGPRAWPPCDAAANGGPGPIPGLLGPGFNSTVGDPTEEATPLKIARSGISGLQPERLWSAEAVQAASLGLDPSPATP